MIVRDLFEWVVGTILWVVLCGLVVTSSCDDRAEAIARATSNGTVVMTVPTEAQIVNKAVFEEIQRVLENMGAACTAPSGRNAAIAVRLERRDELRRQLRISAEQVSQLPRREQALALKDWQCGWPHAVWKHHSRP